MEREKLSCGKWKGLKGNSDPADPDSHLEVSAPFLSSLVQVFLIKSDQRLLSSVAALLLSFVLACWNWQGSGPQIQCPFLPSAFELQKGILATQGKQ